MELEKENETIVRRFYGELWNGWRLDLIDQIVSSDLRFRGSLGSTHEGREEFKRYIEKVRAAFPDWHNQIDEMLAVDDRVVTRMTWSGTHRGALGGSSETRVCDWRASDQAGQGRREAE